MDMKRVWNVLDGEWEAVCDCSMMSWNWMSTCKKQVVAEDAAIIIIIIK